MRYEERLHIAGRYTHVIFIQILLTKTYNKIQPQSHNLFDLCPHYS